MQCSVQRGFMAVVGLLLMLCTPFGAAIPLGSFYSYGTTFGDSVLPPNDDGSSSAVPLPTPPFLYFGTSYTSIYVNNNGDLTFNAPYSGYTPQPFPISGNPMIAPFFADVDTRVTGKVLYRATSDSALLAKAANDIRPIITGPDFTPLWLLIATWDHVGYYSGHSDKTNTFQCILAADNVRSFVIFQYADGLIQWTTGDAAGGVGGLGGTPAQVGFNAGDSKNYANVQDSRTPAIINITRTSNVLVAGQWIFSVQDAVILPPPCKCQNGGSCSGSVCTCPPGYTGTLCETPCPTSCASGYYLNNCNCAKCDLSCKNGGVLQSATCTCDCSKSVIYEGPDCTSCKCQNGGTCSGSVCTCPPGYTGTLCETPCPTSCQPGYYLNNCNCAKCDLSCKNGGVLQSATCTCDCSKSVIYGGPDCTSCKCQNKGTCSGSVCTCPPGYTGTLCETPCPTSCPSGYYVNNCNCAKCDLSCKNGGVLQSATCTCDCSKSVIYGGPDCTSCKCQNGGTCSGSVCTCPPGYTGTLCETPCPTSCPSGYYVNNCNCAKCDLSCKNGGVLQSATCTCDCSKSVIYGGPDCTTCNCQNKGTCSGSACTCPSGYGGTLCDTPCPSVCPQGYKLQNCKCELNHGKCGAPYAGKNKCPNKKRPCKKGKTV